MAKAQLLMSAELERAFADAQGGKVRFVKVAIDGEAFVVSAVGAASSDVRRDAQTLVAEYLPGDQAAFVLFCLDVNVPALRWILLAFVPEGVNVRDKMLYSSSRESLKKQLGMNYFVGEFHATETSDVTFESFQNAKKKHAADAPLSETERLLKETALLERDTNVKSTAMGVIPFEITQNVREKLALFKDGKFDWIAMKLNTDDESVEVVKSLETVDLIDVQGVIDHKAPSFVAYRYRGSLVAAQSTLIFLYVCPEESPVRQKMVYSTCKATVLAATSGLGIEFDKTIEINTPSHATDDIRADLAPPKTEDEVKAREFSRPVAPGRGRGRGRGRGPPGATQ
uniref:ADF-H domain-containing protein n=1 Tax=Globisporangium ultimum (strain ATCC 200006 / CBS 805.95 / DAOM BR144) TaxID=431595 RepID=K3WLI0_GLOUD